MVYKSEIWKSLYPSKVFPLILAFIALFQFTLYVNGCKPKRTTGKKVEIAPTDAKFKAEQKELFIYCSKSLKPLVSKIAQIYKLQYSVSPIIAPASDPALLSTLRHTRKGDLLITMSPLTIDAVEREKLIKEIQTIAFIEPVLAVRQGKGIKSLKDICEDGLRVGVVGSKGSGLSETTRKLCKQAGVWNKLQGNIVVKAKSSSELLRLLKLEAIDAAILWNSGKILDDRNIAVISLPNAKTARGKLKIILLNCSEVPVKAKAFIDVALSDEASSLLHQQGFVSSVQP